MYTSLINYFDKAFFFFGLFNSINAIPFFLKYLNLTFFEKYFRVKHNDY